MALQVPHRRFDIGDYHRMVSAGILAEDDRVELIEGEIVEMSPIGSVHVACVIRLVRVLATAVGHRGVVSPQNPIAIEPSSEPQPDVCLLRPRADDYAASLPAPDDVLLLVEVSDSSLAYDRQVKLPLYARAGIPEVWIADLTAMTVTSYRQPSATGYRLVRTARGDDSLDVEALPGVSVRIADILPG